MNNERRMWLMSEEFYDKFKTDRMTFYSSPCKVINDDLITKFYLHRMIKSLRKKGNQEDFFTLQKFLYTSISLFKRYYLVNQYEYSKEPLQHIFCCMYLALKLNQFPQTDIIKFIEAWKTKKMLLPMNDKKYLHFGEEGYSEKQMAFVSDIGFQVGISPLIQPLESLHHQIVDCFKKKQCFKELDGKLIKIISEILYDVYTDEKLVFLYPGPKLAIAIALVSLRCCLDSKLSQNFPVFFEYLGKQVQKICEDNEEEVVFLTEKIADLKKFEATAEITEQVKAYRSLLKGKGFAKPDRKSKSPKMSPKAFSPSSPRAL